MTFIIFLFPFSLLATSTIPADSALEIVIENFSNQKPGDFPSGFDTHIFQQGKAKKVYFIETEGENHYLSAQGKNRGVQIFKKFPWNANSFPYLSWKWRAKVLPQDAAENKPEANDSACAVYIVFGGWRGKAIKYVWSSSLPVGTILEDSPNTFYIHVSQRGEENLGRWQTIKLNVLEEYRRFFKSELKKNPTGIGILTDGDQTQSSSLCDYDDFRISKN